MTTKKKITFISILSIVLLLASVYYLTSEYLNNKKYNLKESIITEELKPAFNNNNIAVAFASDNNYAKYLSVAIISLTDNMSKDHNYDIVILEDNIKDKSKRLLLEQVKDFKNVSLRFIDINKYFDVYNNINFVVNGHFTRSVYNRLFIPEIFKNYNKVIYLDADVLINDNLIDLYNVDLNDNLLAGVHDTGNQAWLPKEAMTDSEFYDYIKQEIGVDPKEYINSGVILFNIKKCLEDNFLNLCLEVLKEIKNPGFPDQDVINKACNGRIKYLDYRYNFITGIFLEFSEEAKKYVPEYILNDAKIIHFAGHHPWRKYLFSDSIAKWIELSTKSPFFKSNKIEIFKLEFLLVRYKICSKVFRSEKKITRYKNKIKDIKERIEFIKKL